MYRKKFVNFRKSAELEPFESPSYRSFSHFVLGGCDITGEHTALTNATVFDNPSEVPDFSPPSPLTSPRCGIMELAEFVGVKRAKKMAESKDKN